jgi:hypothetical protein
MLLSTAYCRRRCCTKCTTSLLLSTCANKQGTYEYCTVMHTSLAALAFEIYDRHAVGVLVSDSYFAFSICVYKHCDFSSSRSTKRCSMQWQCLVYAAALHTLATITLTLSMLSATVTATATVVATAAATAAGPNSYGACDARCIWQELEQ